MIRISIILLFALYHVSKIFTWIVCTKSTLLCLNRIIHKTVYFMSILFVVLTMKYLCASFALAIEALHWNVDSSDTLAKSFLLFSLINNLWWCYLRQRRREKERTSVRALGSSNIMWLEVNFDRTKRKLQCTKRMLIFNGNCSRQSSSTWI